jgi:hypothetical protein
MPKMMIASWISVVVTGRSDEESGKIHGRCLGGRTDGDSRARRKTQLTSVTTSSPALRPVAMTALLASVRGHFTARTATVPFDTT